jgi:magnesium transporter
MLHAFNPGTRALDPVSTLPRSGWIHAENPGPEEIARLHRELGVPEDFLRHALDLDEVARVDKDERGASLILLRVAWFLGVGHDVPYRAAPVAVVLAEDRLVTISRIETGVIRDLLALRGLAPERHHRFVLQLVLCTAERFLMHLRDIDREVARLEDELHASLRNQEVIGLLKYQKSLVHFTAALSTNRIMLERLQKDARFQISAEDHDLLEDALIEIRQAIEMATISENVLSQMMDAFTSIISNNLNVVMKVLTALTIVLTFPTMVASFYGMNVRLPGQENTAAFALTLVASLLVSGLVAAIFWRKRWL